MTRTTAVTAVLILSASIVMAAPGYARTSGEPSHAGANFNGTLELTAEQQTAMQELQKTFRDEARPLVAASKNTRREMAAARSAGNERRLTELKELAATQRQELKDLRADQHERMMAILTPAQREQLEATDAEQQSRSAAAEKHR